MRLPWRGRNFGAWTADGTFSTIVPLRVAADWQAAHLRAVVLVQERASRRIVGVESLALGTAN